MMDWTDRHCRYFLRLLSKHTLLYTEMVTTGAIIHGDRARFLDFNAEEHPVALQLGGSNPQQLAQCARLAQSWGYDEVNLNLGCPSDRVQNGMIGACLMAEPELVAECVGQMLAAVNIPVTVKTRIGIDDLDSYEHLARFIGAIYDSGCRVFIIHARKAILSGLSPKENREVPPLDYPRVYQLKQDFPDAEFCLNGGIKTLGEVITHLQELDGVMIGREAYQNPYMLAAADAAIFGDPATRLDRHQAIESYLDYVEAERNRDTELKHMVRHLLGLFHGEPGARAFRRHISENLYKPGQGPELLRQAAAFVPRS